MNEWTALISFSRGPPQITVYTGATKTFSDQATIYHVTRQKNIRLLRGKRKFAKFGLCLLKLNNEVNITKEAYPAIIPKETHKGTLRSLSFATTEPMESGRLEYIHLLPEPETQCQFAYDEHLDDGGEITGLWCMKTPYGSQKELVESDCGAPIFREEDLGLHGVALSCLRGKGALYQLLVVPIVAIRDKIFEAMHDMLEDYQK